jgi:hypothetical protein
MNFPQIRSVQIEDYGRFYESPMTGHWYPSVTTVTGFAKKDFWTKWRSNPENRKTSDLAIARGNMMHELAEAYLKKEYEKIDRVPLSDKVLFVQLKKYLDRINSVYAQEIPMWSDTLRMAGRFDCIGEYDGKPSIIDFKSSKTEKKPEWILNYFQQATAYAHMWVERTGQKLPQIVILVSCDNGADQEFIRSPLDYRESLRDAIDNYWANNDFKELQERAKDAFAKTAVSVA